MKCLTSRYKVWIQNRTVWNSTRR